MRKRKTAFDTLECVLPKDIDRLHPVIGERALVDFYGDGVFRFMLLKSITGWVEVKVKRIWSNDGAHFLCWRDRAGRLHCQDVEEMS